MPVPPPFDLASARVDIGQPINMAGGLNATNVLRTLRPVGPSITACYRAALPRMVAPLDGEARLHLETDGAGVITDVRVGGVGATAATCIAAAIRGRAIAAVDTGVASADVPLVFRAR